MEQDKTFLSKIEESLDKKYNHIQKRELPKLKEEFRFYHTSFTTLYNLLLKKGLLHDDPYKYEKKVSEITVPTEKPFLESEKEDAMSIRLSDFETQLDFLNNYYNFDLESLDLKEIKKLVRLTKYIRWEQLSETSTNMNTRTLAEIIQKVKKGSDNVSSSVTSDAHAQLSKTTKSILKILKSITDYHKENIKYEIRLSVIPKVSVDSNMTNNNRQEAIKRMKKVYPQEMPGKPFYPELVDEILNEEFAPDGDHLKEEALNRLEVEEQQSKKNNQVPFKPMLMEAFRALAASSRPLDEAVQKIQGNNLVIQGRKKSVGEKIKLWIRKVILKEEDRLIYEIDFFDSRTGTTKPERIDFENFIESVEKKVRLFNGILSKMGSIYKKLEDSSEEKLFNYLNKNIEGIHIIHRRLQSLNTYFKTEVYKEQRNRIRGIKNELASIKNCIVKSNKKKHEYVSKKEELEQMKKLGININVS